MLFCELTRPSHNVNQTIISQMENHTSLTPPTLASLNASAPTSNGTRIRRTIGVMYVKYRTSQLEVWIFLKALEKLVVGFSGGLYLAACSCNGFVAASKSSTRSSRRDLCRVMEGLIDLVLSRVSCASRPRSICRTVRSSLSLLACSRVCDGDCIVLIVGISWALHGRNVSTRIK